MGDLTFYHHNYIKSEEVDRFFEREDIIDLLNKPLELKDDNDFEPISHCDCCDFSVVIKSYENFFKSIDKSD